MNRRQFIGAVGGVSVTSAGCLGQSATPERQTDSPSATPTPTPSPTTPVESRVDVPPCPEKPASFTRETVLQFATQFEKSYVVRRTLREHERVTSVDVSVSDSLTERDATPTEEGWVVRFTAIGPAYRYRPTQNSTKTAHVDPRAYTANYFLSRQTVLRATAVEALDPREEGVAVRCPPK